MYILAKMALPPCPLQEYALWSRLFSELSLPPTTRGARHYEIVPPPSIGLNQFCKRNPQQANRHACIWFNLYNQPSDLVFSKIGMY